MAGVRWICFSKDLPNRFNFSKEKIPENFSIAGIEMNTHKKQISVTYPILDTKLFIPEIKSELVRRQRLIARMNDGIDKRLILISAPAGFGKTTLLSEWVSQSDVPAAWISIDPSDNDPINLIRYIIAALQTIKPDFANDVLDILIPPHQLTADSIMLFLIKEIENFPHAFLLALDDYHLVNTRKINRMIELLLERMPRQMCLAIATRADPGFPFSRLRVTGQLTEVRISDLYFTKDETSLFFSQVMQLDLAEKEIDRLLSRTEGWIAGLQLAALSIKDRDDVPAFIDDFAGNDRLVADYLAEEVLRRQPGEIQKFLFRTSILDRLSEPLCEFVTQQQNCQGILEDLEQDNLFLVPLDNRRQWYRYHHLFADLLRQRLLLDDSDRVDQLHMRASEWYEANGYNEEAIDHCLAAKDFNRAVHLMEIFLEASWQGGEHVTILNWLEMLPDRFVFLKPNLCICYASILFESGRQEFAQECLHRLETSKTDVPSPSRVTPGEKNNQAGEFLSVEIQGRIAALRTYWATLRGDLDGVARYSQQALNQLHKEDDAWRMMVFLGAAITHEVEGNVKEAVETHYAAVAAAKKAGSVYFYMVTRVWLAIELNILGRMPEAVEICRVLLNEIEEGKLTFNIAMGHVFGTYGEIIYERNALDESYDYAKKGIALLEEGHDIHHIGWRYACLGKILCSRQDIAAASALLPRMEELLATRAIPPWVSSHIEAVRTRIWLMEHNTKSIESWVEQTMAEPEGGLNRFFEAKYIELARILIHWDRCRDAQKIISPLLKKQEKDGRGLHQMETLMVQTRIFQINNRIDDAIDTLSKAFSIAGPGGYLRVFTDEGQLVCDLLKKFSDSQKETHRTFIPTLQAELEKENTTPYSQGLIEPLSGREMEVLRLISSGRSNKKTAASLFISVNTLKTHLQNIYGKLGVHNRTEAVFKAKEIRLLD